MPEVVERAGRAARAWVLLAAVTGVALVVSLASTLLRDVYYGIPDSMAGAALFMAGGPRVEAWVQANDALHYWTPLKDPGRSTIPFVVAR
jgi:hypothetical protein